MATTQGTDLEIKLKSTRRMLKRACKALEKSERGRQNNLDGVEQAERRCELLEKRAQTCEELYVETCDRLDRCRDTATLAFHKKHRESEEKRRVLKRKYQDLKSDYKNDMDAQFKIFEETYQPAFNTVARQSARIDYAEDSLELERAKTRGHEEVIQAFRQQLGLP